jgi:hypothetical protein
MKEFQDAYSYLLEIGFSQNLIIRKLHEKGVLPNKGRQFSRPILSNIAAGKIGLQDDVKEIVIGLANENGFSEKKAEKVTA